MAKVILNKSTKMEGKGLVLAGVEIEVTDKEEKQLEKDGFLGMAKKSKMPSNEKEIKNLLQKVAELEDGADDSLKAKVKELEAENKTVKAENEEIKKELVKLAGDKEENKGLLSKFGIGGE